MADKTTFNLTPKFMPSIGMIPVWMMAQHLENYFETPVRSIFWEDGSGRKFVVELADNQKYYVEAKGEMIHYYPVALSVA